MQRQFIRLSIMGIFLISLVFGAVVFADTGMATTMNSARGLATGNLVGDVTTGNTVSSSPATSPAIAFTASARVGKAPLTIQFTDRSTQSPTSWLWNFGDGTTSKLQNPVHTYSSVGTYTVTLSATNAIGTNSSTKTSYITLLTQAPISNYNNANLYVANSQGVKYDVPNGVAKVFTYTYVPDTYFVLFEQANGGLNALHISSTNNAFSGSDITRTTNKSGSFWITFSGGQPSMPDGVLMLAVNGTIPDGFTVNIRSSGQEFDPGTPGLSNQPMPTNVTFLDGAVNETFTKSDFIYGPQNWKPCSSSGYPIYAGENQNDPINQYQIMFIDLRVGAVQNKSLPNNGMIKVEYSFTNLTSTAVFNIYGWYEQCNHGTGIIMTNDVTYSGYMVSGTAGVPDARFTANVTSGPSPLAVQFTDTSTNFPTSWLWTFGDGNTSAVQNPAHTYTTAGTYTVNLTASNSAGNNTVTHAGYITVSSGSGTSLSEIGVFRPSTAYWYLDYTNDGTVDKAVKFGKSGDTPVVGDWSGTGISGIGVFRPSTAYWYLDYTNDGTVDKTVKFGKSGDTPVVGDYNGDGTTDIAVFRPSTAYWYLDYTNDGTVDKTVKFGKSGDTPVVAHWA